ncbi:Hypothetical protein CINCED_3A017211 [Cinara cedri]|uniref:Uncharacterized protein n=1 Tax=Cinara cedri TaxID=506608 RepID=A0A5E4MN76_9HEMI|nr:Hypothetical protein CINCED_3A017211 [Cinara cedri]
MIWLSSPSHALLRLWKRLPIPQSMPLTIGYGTMVSSFHIILTRTWVFYFPILFASGHPVAVKKNLCYFELHIGSHLTFSSQLKTVFGRASQVVRTIGSLMPNLKGLSKSKRALLISVVGSKLLYAAPTRANYATKIAKCRNFLIRVQRTARSRTRE